MGQVHRGHALKAKAIAEARIKTDKIESEVLAHVLPCDLSPDAHVPRQAARDARNILRQRMFFVPGAHYGGEPRPGPAGPLPGRRSRGNPAKLTTSLNLGHHRLGPRYGD